MPTEQQPGGLPAAPEAGGLPIGGTGTRRKFQPPEGYEIARQLDMAPLHRYATVNRDAIDVEKRTVELAFSSETPVEQWFGDEILGHSAGEVVLDRLMSGTAAVLVNHDPDQQVGVVMSVSIGADRVGRAVVRFGQSVQANEVFQDIVDGIRSCVSVGYCLYAAVLVETAGAENTYRITSWEPFEISIVAIPADPSVGVGRSRSAVGETRSIPVFRKGAPKMPDDTPLPVPAPAVTVTRSAEPVPPNAEVVLAAERTRTKEIMKIARSCNMADKGERACDDGLSVAQFHGIIADHYAATRQQSPVRPVTELGLSKRDVSGYSLFRAIHAQVSRDWSKAGLEREMHVELNNRLDADGQKNRRGHLLVPYEVMTQAAREVSARAIMARAMNTGTGSAGGDLVATTLAAGSFIEALRAISVLLSLGARTLPGLVGNVEIPRQDGASTAYWLAEGGTATESALTLSQVALSPHTVAGKVSLTRRLSLQSSPMAEMLIREDIMTVLGLGIDLAGISGTGQNGMPTGIMNTSGVNIGPSLGADGGAPTWAQQVKLETLAATSNALSGNLAYLSTPGVAGTLKTVPKVANFPKFMLEDGQVNGYPFVSSNQVPANLTKGGGTGLSAQIFGDFSQVIIAEWGVLDLKIDDVTEADSGGYVLRAFQDVDIGIRHPVAFSVNKDIQAA